MFMSNLQNIWVASFELAQLSFIKKNQISSWTWLLGGIKVKGKDNWQMFWTIWCFDISTSQSV